MKQNLIFSLPRNAISATFLQSNFTSSKPITEASAQKEKYPLNARVLYKQNKGKQTKNYFSLLQI